VRRALLEEALQLERQLHIALLADKLEQQDGDKEQQQQGSRKPAGDAVDGQEEGEEGEPLQTEAEAAAAAADSLSIPGDDGNALKLAHLCTLLHMPPLCHSLTKDSTSARQLKPPGALAAGSMGLQRGGCPQCLWCGTTGVPHLARSP
jgi:hypothetical protein